LATSTPSAAPQIQTQKVLQDTDDNQDLTQSSISCTDSELFELEIVTAEGDIEISWDLITPTLDKSSEVILFGPSASQYEENETYYYSVCLQPSRYRFKMLNIGDASFKMAVGGQEILNSITLDHPSNLYSFRFRVTERGYAPITSASTRS
jgi:hypothetical protein